MKKRRALFSNSIKGIEISIKIGEIEVPRSIIKQMFGFVPEFRPDIEPDPEFFNEFKEEDLVDFGKYIANMEPDELQKKTTQDHFFDWRLQKSIRDVNLESGVTQHTPNRIVNYILKQFEDTNLKEIVINRKERGFTAKELGDCAEYITDPSHNLNLEAHFLDMNRLLIHLKKAKP